MALVGRLAAFRGYFILRLSFSNVLAVVESQVVVWSPFVERFKCTNKFIH